MLAMSLLMVDFVALPVALIALLVLLVLYYRRWSAWRARQCDGAGAGCANGARGCEEDEVHAR